MEDDKDADEMVNDIYAGRANKDFKYITVSCDGVIRLCSAAELIDYAEEFDDCYLHEAYRELRKLAQY